MIYDMLNAHDCVLFRTAILLCISLDPASVCMCDTNEL